MGDRAVAWDTHGRTATLDDLIHQARLLLEDSRSNNVLVSSSENKWETLVHIIAGLHLGESVLFAGSLFSSDVIAEARRLTGEWAPRNSAAFLTSGSTGTPKLVIHDFGALVLAAHNLSSVLDLHGRWIHHLFPTNYMAGVLNCMVLPLICGGRICIDDNFSFSTVLTLSRNIERLRSDAAWLSPRMVAAIGSRADKDASLSAALGKAWKVVTSATGPLTSAVRDGFVANSGVPVLNTYGTTEHMFISAERTPESPLTCGAPLPGVNLRFTGDFVLGPDLTNEGLPLYGSSSTTAAIVLDLLAGAPISGVEFQGRLYRPTGDRASWVGSRLAVHGRTDQLLVVDGLNVPASRYEEVAMKHPDVLEAYCFLRSFPDSSQRLTLALEVAAPDTGGRIAREVRVLLARQVPQFPSVRDVLADTAWPRTASGKLDRPAIRSADRNTDLR